MENDYINLYDESIRAISEELANKSKRNTDSSYMISSLNGNVNINEVDSENLKGIKHLGESRVELAISSNDEKTYELAIYNAATSILKWINIGVIPKQILFDIDSYNSFIRISAYVISGGKSTNKNMFCVEKQYKKRSKYNNTSKGKWVNI